MPPIPILILAAGASARMGRDKLMMEIDGTPLLARAIGRARATGQPVFVTLPGRDHPRAGLVRDAGATGIFVADWAKGMSASLRRGIAALPEPVKGAMILPADMPDLTADDLNILLQVFEKTPYSIIRAATHDGIPGNPVIFPADLFEAMRDITGDQGARGVIGAQAHRLHLVPLPGNHARTDLDTARDWARWHAARTTKGGPG